MRQRCLSLFLAAGGLAAVVACSTRTTSQVGDEAAPQALSGDTAGTGDPAGAGPAGAAATGPGSHPFGSGTAVGLSAGPGHDPALALDAAGVPALAWTDATSGHGQIYVARFDGAAFAGLAGSASGGGLTQASHDGVGTAAIAIDADGTPAVAWTQSVALAAQGGGSTTVPPNNETPPPPAGGSSATARDALMLVRFRAGAWAGIANASPAHPANSGVVPGIFAVDNITWSPVGATGAAVGPPSAPAAAALAIAGPEAFRVALQGKDRRVRSQQVYQVGFNVLADTGDDNAPGVWGFMPPYSAAFLQPSDPSSVVYAAPQLASKFIGGAESTYMAFLRNGAVWVYFELRGPATPAGTWRMAASPVGQGATDLALAVDDSLRAYVAYTVGTGGHSDVYVAMLDASGTTWSAVGGSGAPTNVSHSGGQARHPSLAVTADGHPTLVWEDTASGHAAIYLRTWDGSAWVPVGASDTGAGISGAAGADAITPRVRLDPKGHAVIAWASAGVMHVTAWY